MYNQRTDYELEFPYFMTPRTDGSDQNRTWTLEGPVRHMNEELGRYRSNGLILMLTDRRCPAV